MAFAFKGWREGGIGWVGVSRTGVATERSAVCAFVGLSVWGGLWLCALPYGIEVNVGSGFTAGLDKNSVGKRKEL